MDGLTDDDRTGFFGPRSLAWKVNRDVCCLLAGRRAILLQLAHPLVAAGVSAHSSFHQSPMKRLHTTIELTQTIVFGTRREALAAAATIRGAHHGVHGRLPRAMGTYQAGSKYNASDPMCSAWVLATLVDSALEAHRWFAHPLSTEEQDAYLMDMKRFGEIVGVPHDALPDDVSSFRRWFRDRLESEVVVTPLARRYAAPILDPFSSLLERELPFGNILAGPLGPPSRRLNVLTAGLLPAPVREGFRLPWTRLDRAEILAARRALLRLRSTLPDRFTVMPLARRAESRLARTPGAPKHAEGP